ncbi:RimK family alpha-L-glutamate ligase [Thalassorhabdus alkalitolerans]|uniref:RimK family alpha-L-glutamate ligase n=1 Tax=Thalassorhabdus alkalitolerans TaxID=2282697 RepID=A0ABW0YMC1_9BACI
MKIVTFNPFRTIGIPNIQYIKPEKMFHPIEKDKILQADICLFPEKWQVNALVYGMKKKIFPSIETIHLGYDKIEMTRALLSVCPSHVPYTEIHGRSKESLENILLTFPFPFVGKESRNSMGKGVFLINNQDDFKDYAQSNSTLYVQEYLPINKDLRVCVIGNKVVNAYWRINDESSFYNNIAQGGTISFDNIPQEALDLALETALHLGINHAGFDLVFANNQYYFLEFNVLFGNQGFQEKGIRAEDYIIEAISH